MLKLLRALLAPTPGAATAAASAATTAEAPASSPTHIAHAGLGDFSAAQHLLGANGLPLLDWDAVHLWVEGATYSVTQARAWAGAEMAWLEHLRAALGPGCRLREQGALCSSPA